ncbi:proteasome accessory factor C [Actinoplanes lutulentus]|uniref:Proteasome accessory factor C n=1 Tax=Actinoplanes lutulentus TaxID=1287878 RepID=A0A327ZIJ0_9ACTN|nr:YafY family protein [Actinoplanes lutulentus]MBB2944000.1 proteasome accessory factor C [Actinoplanes lutulentus]RAK42767.1 proteasome accessory factor C [Actinoplanes lutulentus]
MTAPRNSTSADRLGRLLNLVPYLLARPGIRVAEAAGDLGVTEKQLREDLELLWVCGLPGYGPGDLIDMAFDGDRVTISHDAGIDKPLRLNPDEALALVVALRMLAETPGIGTRDAIEGALAKIESAAGDLADAPVAVRLPANQKKLEEVRSAVDSGHALLLTYYTAARDETSERVVDPMRMLMVGGTAYLEAWCRRAEGTRMFRVDRIDAFTELAEPSVPPLEAKPQDVSAGVFRPGPELPLVTMRVGRGSRWITEYYPVEQVQRDGAEWLVTMRVTDLGWAQRFLAGQGRDVTVLGPPELLDRIRAQATTALDQYAEPS